MSTITVPSNVREHWGTNFDPTRTTFAWFWLTNECNENCTHCYAGSGPLGKKSVLSTERWMELLTESRDNGLLSVQFIGGEPTKFEDLAVLIHHAFSLGIQIEVFSNLVDISVENWAAFAECRVSLATSFYSATEEGHDRVTDSIGNQPRILENIKTALALHLPLRVGVIRVFEDQDVDAAIALLKSIGVQNIGTDDVRGIGRGSVHDVRRKEDALCGQCAKGKVCVDYLGRVFPCVFSQWLVFGNVRKASLTDILTGNPIVLVRNNLTAMFAERELPKCTPRPCTPEGGHCSPNLCAPDIAGCAPKDECNPVACEPQAKLNEAFAEAYCVPDTQCKPDCVPSCWPQDCSPANCRPLHPKDGDTCGPDACQPHHCVPEQRVDCRPDGPCVPNYEPKQLIAVGAYEDCVPTCAPQARCRPITGR